MKVKYSPTHEQVVQEREKRYLALWPVEKQLEAYAEALAGRNEKQIQMLKDFAEIRKALPFFEEVK